MNKFIPAHGRRRRALAGLLLAAAACALPGAASAQTPTPDGDAAARIAWWRQARFGIDPGARAVGAAMAQALCHAPDHLAERARSEPPRWIRQPDDAAH